MRLVELDDAPKLHGTLDHIGATAQSDTTIHKAYSATVVEVSIKDLLRLKAASTVRHTLLMLV